jgi:NAD-dependent SIR2 family protein deacetylase
VSTETWDAVMCPNCHWNAYDMRGISDRPQPLPRWCPECERHHHVRRDLTLVTLTAQVRP